MAHKIKNTKKNFPLKKKQLYTSRFQENSLKISPMAIYVVLALTALIYSRALFNDFAAFDDDDYLIKNPYIKNFSFEGIKAIFTSYYLSNYHPLTTLTWFFEYKFFGLNPFPYHLHNVILHLVNIFLVYKLVEKLSKKSLTALIVAILFAVHPMHVESVAWVSERKDVLYTLFYLSALLVYLKYLESGFRWKYYWICLLFFGLSLLSKSAAVTLPVLLLATDLYKSRKPDAKMFLEKLPLLGLSVLFGIIALLSQQGVMTNTSYFFTFFERIFLFTYSISFYIFKLVFPFDLSVFNYYPKSNGVHFSWYYYASLPFVILIIWLVIKPSTFRREKLFGVFFFLIVISVMLQIIAVGGAITAERYTYVSYIGLFYIAGQWISEIQKVKLKKFILVLFGLFVVMLIYLSWDRIKVWKNGNTLFTELIKKYPDSDDAYSMRGNYKRGCEDYHGALEDYNRSLELFPDNVLVLNERAGILLNEYHDYQASLRDLNKLISLDSSVWEAYCNRGMAYNALNDTVAAMRDYNKAILKNPHYLNAYNNRAALKIGMGNLEGALSDINKAISLDPNDNNPYTNRSVIKFMQNDFSGCIEDCNIALKKNPKDATALYNRGQSLLRLNDTAGACEDFHKAYQMDNETAGEIIKELCK